MVHLIILIQSVTIQYAVFNGVNIVAPKMSPRECFYYKKLELITIRIMDNTNGPVFISNIYRQESE
jgi:hypothetical protein